MPRDTFRESVFKRDDHKCIVCQEKAMDAHHIIERRLFPDGGYYLDNGASLCSDCHILAEQTVLPCEEIRRAAKIETIILPPHFCPEDRYDKWGNIILPNGTRIPGELFYDESVQKILKEGNVLELFTNKVKYPRTYHFPWSPGASADDKILDDLSGFEGEEVVVTVKMDGENTSLYRDGMHARSLDGNETKTQRESRAWLRSWHAAFAYEIPEDWRICGENLFAAHSIQYSDLKSYFLGFSIWDKHTCLSWDETLDWFSLLGITPVPILYRGLWDESMVRSLVVPDQEGYVVRVARSFGYREFRKVVGKYVRAGHVTSDSHWAHKKLIKNTINSY